jgi:hypothetical protein
LEPNRWLWQEARSRFEQGTFSLLDVRLRVVYELSNFFDSPT